jgi:hypothetical protein
VRTPVSIASIALSLLAASPADAIACSIIGWPVPAPLSIAPQLTVDAEWIVRATAVDYAQRPSDPAIYTTGLPDSIVRFRVEEVLKGAGAPTELTIPGYLSEADDFNDRPAPYHFVRPGGRSGSCFANAYRRGASFLLMLKRDSGGRYTPYWGALQPVNEQLRSETDDWITWVRNQVYEDSRTTPRLDPDRLRATYAVYSAVIGAMRSGAIPLQAALPASLEIFGRTVVPVEMTPFREPGSSLPVSRDLQTDFANGSVLQDPIVRQFAIDGPYEVVPVARHQDYRGSPTRSLLAFSQVGVDPAAASAIVYFSYQCSRDCGTGGYVVLLNRGDGWRVDRVIDAWKVSRTRE